MMRFVENIFPDVDTESTENNLKISLSHCSIKPHGHFYNRVREDK